MSEEPLCVTELSLRRAPGFESERIRLEDLSTGVNVVYGPNASGKTTVAHAIQWMLWPELARDRTDLSGRVSLNGQDLRIEVDHGRTRYQRDGQDASGPNLPSADQRDRYYLALHDLLQRGTRNEAFAELIKRESVGGYDLETAADAVGFDDSPGTRGLTEVKDAESAIEAWRETNRDVQELRNEQRRLTTLERDLEEASEARRRARLLEQAVDYAKARDEVEEARERFEKYPAELQQFDGTEANAVDDLEERIADWREKMREAEANESEARSDLEAADLPADGIPDGVIEGLHSRLDDLEELEAEKRRYERRLEGASERLETALQDIPLALTSDDLEELEPVAWEEMTEFVKLAQTVTANRELRDAVESWLGEGDRPETDQSTLERGRQALENWLASPPPTAPTNESNDAFTIGAISAALLALASIALGVLVHPLLFVSLVLAAGVFWYGYRSKADIESADDPRRTHRESFERLDLEPPETWTEDAVRNRLTEIDDAIVAHRLDSQRKERLDVLESKNATLDENERRLEQQRETLRQHFGAAPDTTDLELVATVTGVFRWQEAHERLVGVETKLETIDSQIETARNRLESELQQYGYGDVEDAAAATRFIRNLEERNRRHERAIDEIDRAEAVGSEATDRIEELRVRRDAIYTDVGLEPGVRDRLDELCEQVDEYETARNEVNELERVAANERSDLVQLPDYEPELEDAAVRDLESRRREAAESAAEYDEINTKKTAIETRIGEAKRDSAVEEALTEKERALAELADRYREVCGAMVGNALVDHVRSETSDASRPEVFNHAREILARITKGRYRLDLEADGDTFRAYDTVTERGFALDELSSGTQLQVLLAVRIAFVERQEKGLCLPLLLDETLANSDDDKAMVIIESAIELAKEGRQVFYFTAQADEVNKWIAALDETAGVAHSVTTLDGMADHEDHVQLSEPDVELGSQDSLPDPANHDHESFGEAIEVPPLNPRRGAGFAHLWYVVDDVSLLYRLLELNVERWGQLKTLFERGSGDLIADDRTIRAELETEGRALEAFVRAWQHGRGERVTRAALEASGAVSAKFIDEVTELAKSVDGDADRIIESLRSGDVDRFWSNKVDELETYFETNGYIESTAALDAEQIRLRVIESYVNDGVSREAAVDRADVLLSRIGW